MRLWHTLLALGLSAFAIACTSAPQLTAPNPAELARAEDIPTQNGAIATFVGEEPPAWAAEAVEIMAELETWRGKAFTEDLKVTFAPARGDGLKGWYDSQTHQLVVVESDSERFGRGVLLHEIFHALQDQTFNLEKLHLQAQAPDADYALRALIEGEAMLAVSDLLDYDFAAHAKLPPEGEIGEATLEKLYLYGAGLKFVRALKAAGGWEALDAAFQDPPRSTALIFHPDRYLAGEREVPALPLEPGEAAFVTATPGEYGLWLWLAQSPESRLVLASAGEAFQGDKLVQVETATGQTQKRWVLQFSDPDVAAQVAAVAPAALAVAGEELATAKVTTNLSDRGGRVEISW